MDALKDMVGCGDWCIDNESGCVFDRKVIEDLYEIWQESGVEGMVEYCVKEVPWGRCDVMKVLELINLYWSGGISDEEFRDRFEGCLVYEP